MRPFPQQCSRMAGHTASSPAHSEDSGPEVLGPSCLGEGHPGAWAKQEIEVQEGIWYIMCLNCKTLQNFSVFLNLGMPID